LFLQHHNVPGFLPEFVAQRGCSGVVLQGEAAFGEPVRNEHALWLIRKHHLPEHIVNTLILGHH
jgi:hypothetical protein